MTKESIHKSAAINHQIQIDLFGRKYKRAIDQTANVQVEMIFIHRELKKQINPTQQFSTTLNASVAERLEKKSLAL